MKERLLVLAKACPEMSKKYMASVCVAGVTDKGEWRRIYPIPWSVFWSSSDHNFKKKSWIEYELVDDSPSDYRPESRKIKFDTIKPLREATYAEIEGVLRPKLTSIEALESLGAKTCSLGVVEPRSILDFVSVDNEHYLEMVSLGRQQTLGGRSVIPLDIPKDKHQYKFMDDLDGREHGMLCEDWEVGELYRKCVMMLKEGRYADMAEVHSKVRDKMLNGVNRYGHTYFVVGSHFRWSTFMIVGVVYPRKADIPV